MKLFAFGSLATRQKVFLLTLSPWTLQARSLQGTGHCYLFRDKNEVNTEGHALTVEKVFLDGRHENLQNGKICDIEPTSHNDELKRLNGGNGCLKMM